MSLDPRIQAEYFTRFADSNLILGHRLSEWLGKAPMIEQELALANIGLDLIGQARALYVHVVSLNDDGRDEDDLVFSRDVHQYRNVLLVEKENQDFAVTIARQLLYSSFAQLFWAALEVSTDQEIRAIAAKATKEATYHTRYAGEWLVRLGDGTSESHARTQNALDDLWMYTGELFEMDDVDRAAFQSGIGVDMSSLEPAWKAIVEPIIERSTLTRPHDEWMISGSRAGHHTEHLGHLLAEMQYLQRVYPNQKW